MCVSLAERGFVRGKTLRINIALLCISISVWIQFEAWYLSIFSISTQNKSFLFDGCSKGHSIFLQDPNVGHIAALVIESTIIQFLQVFLSCPTALCCLLVQEFDFLLMLRMDNSFAHGSILPFLFHFHGALRWERCWMSKSIKVRQ